MFGIDEWDVVRRAPSLGVPTRTTVRKHPLDECMLLIVFRLKSVHRVATRTRIDRVAVLPLQTAKHAYRRDLHRR